MLAENGLADLPGIVPPNSAMPGEARRSMMEWKQRHEPPEHGGTVK